MAERSSFEYRAVSNEEMDDYIDLVKYVFADNSQNSRDVNLFNPKRTTAAFHKGQLAAALIGFPMVMRLNGKYAFVDGLTKGGTLPEFRRRGLMRGLITRRIQQTHQHEYQCALIHWASMAAAFQRYGYGMGSTQAYLKFDPAKAELDVPQNDAGYVRFAKKEEGQPIVRSLYQQFTEKRSLDLVREDSMWHGLFSDASPLRCAIYFNANNHPEGFISYQLARIDRAPTTEAPMQKLDVWDFIYLNIDAYSALWEFIRSHDLVSEVNMSVPLDDPAFHLAQEPRDLGMRVADGIWLRAVDVDQFLTCRRYSMPGTVVLEIKEDKECPWNIRKYQMETDGNKTVEVQQTRRTPQFQITPNGLASLVCGNASLSLLQRIGRATVNDPDELGALDAMFATDHKPFCRNVF